MTSSKWHALGNSYLVIDEPMDADAARRLSAEAETDGVIEVLSEHGPEASLQIWNPDGSRAEFSGNGARIAAAWLAERAGEDYVVLRFGDRETSASVSGAIVALDLGPVEVGRPEKLDLEEDSIEFTPVSVGNPHAVIRGNQGIGELGPRVETHPRFPDRTNVQLVHVVDRHELRIAIWERGAGETSASGSSSVAAAAAAIANGWCESPVTVHQPGGDLLVEIQSGQATLIGPVERLS